MRSSFVAILSLALAASSVAADNSRRAGGGFGNFGKFGGNKGFGGKKGGAGGNKATTTTTVAAAATTTTTTAAAGSTNAAAAGNGGSVGPNSAQTGATVGNSNPQDSLTLVDSVICTACNEDGQGNVTEAGQVASLTSPNNFINFCAETPNVPITNGLQIKTGSCNPIPMGFILSTSNLPTSKFTNPKNLDTIPANQNFTITMAITHLETGNFVNPETNYYAAPAQVNGQGDLIGHSHVNIVAINGLSDTATQDIANFAFFKGFNEVAQGGVLSAVVAGGLPAGTYKMCSINSAANHQPALASVAQHGPVDDCSYFTATDGGAPAAAAPAAGGAPTGGAAAGGNKGGNKGGKQRRCNVEKLRKRQAMLESRLDTMSS